MSERLGHDSVGFDQHPTEPRTLNVIDSRGHSQHPHTVTPSDQLTYTRTVEITFDRGTGPILPQAIHDACVTLVRLVYTYVSPASGWTCEIGPVHGHVIDDEGRLGTRIRSLRPRTFASSEDRGWPDWILALAEAHQPHTVITVTEEIPS